MKKRNTRAAMICAAGLALSALTAGTAFAEETENLTEAAAAAEETEEIGTEAGSEAETEAETEAPQRPEYVALDYVTLGQYKGLTIEQSPIEVTEDEIDARIASNIKYSADGSETLTEGVVQKGDTANIDFEGKKDGVAFDGGTSEGYDLEIGSGSFIPGFEEGLEGVEIGKTVDLDLTFPENYGNEELAGQAVVFTVTVNSVSRPKELDDALASALSDGEATTVASYRELVASTLEDEKLQDRDMNNKAEILTLVSNNSTINEYPQELVDFTMNEMVSYYESYAEAYGMEFEEFLTAAFGVEKDQFMKEAEGSVKENLRQEILVQAIAEQEGLMPNDETYKTQGDALAAEYGYESVDDLSAAYGQAAVKSAIVYNLVMDFLEANTTIVDTTEPESESELDLQTEEETGNILE